MSCECLVHGEKLDLSTLITTIDSLGRFFETIVLRIQKVSTVRTSFSDPRWLLSISRFLGGYSHVKILVSFDV